jgi:hypothetical protein
MSQNSDKVAIVTVHGTGDTAETLTGQKWYQQGSPFAEQVTAQLRAGGVEAEIIPHLWSGANSAWDRERGANKLAARIRGLYNKYDTIHVVAHSHGGNVANDAAVLLKWGLRANAKRERFDSLTTIGTPFFNVRTGPIQLLAGVLFQVLAIGSAIAFPITAISWLYFTLQAPPNGDMGLLIAPFIYAAIVTPCVWLMLHMSSQGIRRVLRPRTGGRTKTSIFSIWHDNDEAIAFLQRVEELKLEPFPRGALFRGSRSSAISFGVLAVIAIAVAIPVLFVFGVDILRIRELSGPTIDPVTGAAAPETAYDFLGLVIAVLVLGLWLAPPLFTGIYLAFRYLFGGAAEIGARGTMNRYVGGLLRGIAMGRDGDQILCNVAPRSHTHRTEEMVLSGECAARMREAANGAAGRLIDKYRWALFSVGGDSSASLTALTTDAMTWDSLVHTTYFDQPEVARAVGDHILRAVRESAHAEARAAAAAGAQFGGAAPQPT